MAPTIAVTPVTKENSFTKKLPKEIALSLIMAGLGLSDQKSTARRDHAHRNHLQNLH
jgi:hypothetical protein